MHREGGSEDVLLQEPLNPDLRALPLSVRGRGEYLVHYPRPVLIRKIRVLVVTTQKPETKEDEGKIQGFRGIREVFSKNSPSFMQHSFIYVKIGFKVYVYSI